MQKKLSCMNVNMKFICRLIESKYEAQMFSCSVDSFKKFTYVVVGGANFNSYSNTYYYHFLSSTFSSTVERACIGMAFGFYKSFSQSMKELSLTFAAAFCFICTKWNEQSNTTNAFSKESNQASPIC